MADHAGSDPYATIVDPLPPTRPAPWWIRAWTTLAGRIYTLVVVATLLFVAFTVVYEVRGAELERAVALARTEVSVRDLAGSEAGAFARTAAQIDSLAARLEPGPITPGACASAAGRSAATDPLLVSVSAFTRDGTERKRPEALLAEQALNDPLTGLPNRRSFDAVDERLLSQAKRTGELVAVGFVDLDDFKAVNDTHGHQAADVLLQEVATRLRAAVRAGDVVARLGGDDPESLLRAADGAMDHAKRAGEGRVAFAEAAAGDGGERSR